MGIRIVDSLVGAVAAKTTVCFTRTAGLFDRSKMLTRTRPLVRPTLTTAKSNFPSPFTSRRMSYSFRTGVVQGWKTFTANTRSLTGLVPERPKRLAGTSNDCTPTARSPAVDAFLFFPRRPQAKEVGRPGHRGRVVANLRRRARARGAEIA